MYAALRGALTLALLILVVQIFLPEVASRLIELITRVIDILLYAVNQTATTLPH